MTRTLTYLLLATGLALQTFGQTNKTKDNLTIDLSIKDEVEKYISPFGEKTLDSLGLIYNNQIKWDVFEGEKLIHSTRDSTNGAPFKAFYQIKDDTLFIVGEYGLISGFRFGFISTTHSNQISVRHFFCDETPTFKLKETDTLQYCIDVSCLSSNLTLTKMPKSNDTETLYGLAEFETENFYEKSNDGVRKIRSKMSIYFRALQRNFKE